MNYTRSATFDIKLDDVLQDYCLDRFSHSIIGAFTRVLNSYVDISEEKVREIILIEEIDPEQLELKDEGKYSRYYLALLQGFREAVQSDWSFRLGIKNKPTTDQITNYLIKAVIHLPEDIPHFIVQALFNRERLKQLAEYLHQNWERLLGGKRAGKFIKDLASLASMHRIRHKEPPLPAGIW
jgi:hypothetical protein